MPDRRGGPDRRPCRRERLGQDHAGQARRRPLPAHRGRITWDGTDSAELDPASLADRVVMVLQEPLRWPHTARANVRIDRHDRDDPADAALNRAAAGARADEIVAGLPNRWDTLLSKYFRGGHELSGGQWQRFAVARGLFRDAPADLGRAGGRTVILITHRLASVRHADRIFLLHEGALAEQGTHAELLAARGRYAELYELQARLHGATGEHATT